MVVYVDLISFSQYCNFNRGLRRPFEIIRKACFFVWNLWPGLRKPLLALETGLRGPFCLLAKSEMVYVDLFTFYHLPQNIGGRRRPFNNCVISMVYVDLFVVVYVDPMSLMNFIRRLRRPFPTFRKCRSGLRRPFQIFVKSRRGLRRPFPNFVKSWGGLHRPFQIIVQFLGGLSRPFPIFVKSRNGYVNLFRFSWNLYFFWRLRICNKSWEFRSA